MRIPDPRGVLLPRRLAFVVQLSPTSEAARGGLGGRVSQVVSARSAPFSSIEECLAFIARVLGESDREEGGAP